MRRNWAAVKERINKVNLKVKVRLNKLKKDIDIRERNKILLLIKNFTNDKLKILYIKVFKVKEVKGVTILLKLLNTKTYLRFHVSLLKKAPLDTKIITT